MNQQLLVLTDETSLGKYFCDRAKVASDVRMSVVTCNRDRVIGQFSQTIARHWNWIVDLNCSRHEHLEDLFGCCTFDHYSLLSSSTVDLSWPGDELFSHAQNRLWLEHIANNAAPSLLIIRTGYVVHREMTNPKMVFRGGVWLWAATEDPVQPVIDAQFLAGLIWHLAHRRHTGIVRAGYNAPRIMPSRPSATV